MTGLVGEAGGLASSLALLPGISTEEEEDPGFRALRCPRKKGWFYVGQDTGEVVPARCGTAWCWFCGPLNAQEIAGAIGLADPERLVTLTLVGDSWAETQLKVQQLVRDVRAAGFEFEYVMHVEPNPRGTGRHAHIFQKGDYIPQDFLQERCFANGLGIPDIRAFVPKGGPKVAYGVKLAGIDYGLKLTERAESLAGYLAVNGGRLTHQSRGFFSDEYGVGCGVLEARRAWRRVVTTMPQAWGLRHRPDWETLGQTLSPRPR